MGVMLGVRYLLEGALAKAISEFQQAVLLNPHSVTAHYLLGVGQFQRENFSEAERELSAALRIDPHYQQAKMQLLLCFIAEGRHQLALRSFVKLTAKAFSLPQGSFIEEVATNIAKGLEDKLSLNFHSSEIFNSLGIAHYLLGHKGKAGEYWEKSLQVAPYQPLVRVAIRRLPLASTRKAKRRR